MSGSPAAVLDLNIQPVGIQLAGDVLAYDDGIHLRTLYLEDIDLNLLAGELLQLFLELVDLLTALADDDARTGGGNGYRNSFSVRSMMIFEMLALARRTFRYLRILASSTSFSEKSLPPNAMADM